MKICPTCRQTYTDDGLNFCLNDGAMLTAVSGQNSPPPTVFMTPPHQTAPPNSYGSRTNEQVTLDNRAQYAPQSLPQKSSKTWIWVVGILGLVVLLCGGGMVGLLALAGMSDLDNNNSRAVSNKKMPVNAFPADNSSSENSASTKTTVQKINFADWIPENTEDYGDTEVNGDELTISSKSKNFYYVLMATKYYQTENATTRVTVSNKDLMSSTLGYGLVFHGDTQPLQKDYAFLIDSLRQKYRIVFHAPQKETPAVNWTFSNAIKSGAAENKLEVRDAQGSMDFYINGVKVSTLRNTQGYAGGVVGIYSGDAARATFSALEIEK